MATAGNETGMQPKSAKSYAGLTRTLEEDLKSNDPYLRERAQRFLRLQLQLLKLRSRQAEASEITTQNSAMDAAYNSMPVNSVPAYSQSTSPANQSSEPLSNPKTGSDEVANRESLAEPASTDDDTQTPNTDAQNPDDSNQPISPDDGISDDNMSGETNVAATEPSANASLLENVVVDGPIDRLGLANNLFAVGEYPLALEMYQETKGSELSTQQQFWVEYQTANCYRRLGNPAEASNRYRKLASQSEAGWLARQAHWWVEMLESIRIHEKALKFNSVQVCQKVIENVEAEVIETPAESAALSTVPATSQNPEPVKNEHAN